jgi:gamma-glutamyltranspeptidase
LNMRFTCSGTRGSVVAPHHLASQAGLSVLREGGNAIEAMVAAAAAIAVVYPHMNSLGGDGFWLIHQPGQRPVAINACGRSGASVDAQFYRSRGLDAIPARGPLAANTVAGTVSGWQVALEVAAERGGTLPLSRLLEDAVFYAQDGVPATQSQCDVTADKRDELIGEAGFSQTYLTAGKAPTPGVRFVQSRLAQTLRAMGKEGADSFYRGELARQIAADLARVGSPVSAADLASHRAVKCEPLALKLALSKATVYNFPPPTQGVASLMILGLFERLIAQADLPKGGGSFAHLHYLVEATKQAFMLRNREVGDPAHMRMAAQEFLEDRTLDALAANVDKARALAWPQPQAHGDTVWLGAVDKDGCAVSFIQSIYWEFGAGVVLDECGLTWQNRGSSFALDAGHPNSLAPAKQPFHTLNPALALFDDGRVMSYGTMGGEGQPQTQASVFTRYAHYGERLCDALDAPRWLLGRTWGAESVSLKLESRFETSLIDALKAAGHVVEVVNSYDPVMGHAGALVRQPNGVIDGASDPRCDGQVATF